MLFRCGNPKEKPRQNAHPNGALACRRSSGGGGWPPDDTVQTLAGVKLFRTQSPALPREGISGCPHERDERDSGGYTHAVCPDRIKLISRPSIWIGGEQATTGGSLVSLLLCSLLLMTGIGLLVVAAFLLACYVLTYDSRLRWSV